MTDRPEDVIRNALKRLDVQEYAAHLKMTTAPAYAALSDLITERDGLNEYADKLASKLSATQAERDRLRETLRFIGWEMHDPVGVVLDARRQNNPTASSADLVVSA